MNESNIVDPFSDPELKKSILNKEGVESSSIDLKKANKTLGDGGEDFLNTIISNSPKIPKSAKNIILDANMASNLEKIDKSKVLSKSLSDIFTQYNKEYGTCIEIDFDSFSKTLINVSDPKKRRVLDLYLSEVFQTIRPVLILNLIQRLSLAIEYVTDPKRMFDHSNLSIPDLFLVIEKLMGYINDLNQMAGEIVIKGSDLELKRLKKDGDNLDLSNPENRETINSFMSIFNKDFRNRNENTESLESF